MLEELQLALRRLDLHTDPHRRARIVEALRDDGLEDRVVDVLDVRRCPVAVLFAHEHFGWVDMLRLFVRFPLDGAALRAAPGASRRQRVQLLWAPSLRIGEVPETEDPRGSERVTTNER